MATLCPNGHTSEADDYCDSCGTRLGGVVADDDDDDLVVDASEPAPDVDPEPCPRCSTMRVGDDSFCENCGHRFGTEAIAERVWEVEVTADREHYDRVPARDIEFPTDLVRVVVKLTEAEMLIGRRSESRGVHPEIDCAGPPDDPAVSHRHALLVRDDDGNYAVCDLGSTNGTTINDDPKPLTKNALVPLEDGDRIHIGAWTTLTIRPSR